MTDWFSFESGGQTHVARKSNIRAAGTKSGDRIFIRFDDGKTYETKTYDLVGFIANVLEDTALEASITCPD